ncbi:MAG: aconitate hydratase [Candidatus Competibacteraceae bacterium]|nr:aconitate hydratase [Candidatus Competibacteraceae bacterium]
MSLNLSQKLIRAKRVEGSLEIGDELSLSIDQVLLQDVLGTLTMLELEVIGIDRVTVEPAVQYIDHSLVQLGGLNAEAHAFLRSACQRFGVWYSGPGNGISHPVHMERFGKPGASLVGCDSHTPAAGSLGMLAIGAGGVEVAAALAGEPLVITMPAIWGVKLVGEPPPWVSAKDIILEMLRRHGVAGGLNTIIEYYGPGLERLSAMDRHVIANMGAELGATTSVFPSDQATRRFLAAQGREGDWMELAADPGAEYDRHEEIDLGALEPLIAQPSSPDKVVPVAELAGQPVHQSYLGSSANPGYRDFAIAAAMVKGRRVAEGVSLDVNPGTRQVLQALIQDGQLGTLVAAGARLHQPGCNGCIGMGQAPAVGQKSLRTVPRNFPGRSGTREDSVFLCSPETATASALTGVITDPRTLGLEYPSIDPDRTVAGAAILEPPLSAEAGARVPLLKTDNITRIPDFEPLAEDCVLPVLLRAGDNVSTDDIMPAGEALPYWSSIERSANFAFIGVDRDYLNRIGQGSSPPDHIVVGGHNYGQGSSRENASIVARYLGVRIIIARSFARIHWANLVSFGVLPLTFTDGGDYQALTLGTRLAFDGLLQQLNASHSVTARLADGQGTLHLHHELSPRQIEVLRVGGLLPWLRTRKTDVNPIKA